MDVKPELENPRARWIALAVTCLAGVLAAIQSSSLIVALVQLVSDLKATFASIIWVLLAFMLAIGATAPVLGFFSDSGLKGVRCKLFNFGFAIFGLASLLCGFAQPQYGALDLICYRALMGIGAGFIFSNSSPILADKFHPYGQMGLAQGVWGIAFALGSVVGPVVGGLLLQAGWSWIFWFNVPFCVVGCSLGFWQVKDYIPPEVVGPDGQKKPQITFVQVMKRFDYLGAFLLLMAIISLFIAVVSSIFPTPQLGSTATIAFGTVCGSCALLFFGWDYYRRNDSPFVNFKVFNNRNFTLCALGNVASSLARGGLTFAFIFLYQGPFGQDALQAGIKVIPFGVGLILGGFPSGRIGDLYGYKLPSIIGPVVSALGIMGAAFIKGSTNYWVTAAYLFFAGIGGGIYNSPTTALMMLSIKPSDRGQGSGLVMMMQMVANAFSIVICFDLIVGQLDSKLVYQLFIVGGGGLSDATLTPFMNGFHGVIWIIVACNIIASLCSSQLKDFKRPKPGATTVAVNQAKGETLKELIQKESEAQPELEEPAQPEPLVAPLEGLDANPVEDAEKIAVMEKLEAREHHHEGVELVEISVKKDSLASPPPQSSEHAVPLEPPQSPIAAETTPLRQSRSESVSAQAGNVREQ